MKASYGVLWQEPEQPLIAGKLELETNQLRLEGKNGTGVAERAIPYRELAGLEIVRDPGHRLGGHPTLILQLRGGGEVRIASLAQAGIVAEIAENLTALQTASEQADAPLLVVLRIKSESREEVRRLLAEGPPFDPELLALEQHHVFMVDDQVFMLFDGTTETDLIARLVRKPTVWRAALAWREHLAGPPMVAESLFRWDAPADLGSVGHLAHANGGR